MATPMESRLAVKRVVGDGVATLVSLPILYAARMVIPQKGTTAAENRSHKSSGSIVGLLEPVDQFTIDVLGG